MVDICVYNKFCSILNLNPTSLNSLSSCVSEVLPDMESATIDLASDFELPGLPTRNNGILNSIQITIINTFSLKAAFLAMFSPSFMLFRRTSCALNRERSFMFTVSIIFIIKFKPFYFMEKLAHSFADQRCLELLHNSFAEILSVLKSSIITYTQ